MGGGSQMLALLGCLVVFSRSQAAGSAALYGVVEYQVKTQILVEIDPVTGRHDRKPFEHAPFQSLPYLYSGIQAIDTKRNVMWTMTEQNNATYGGCEFLSYNVANGVSIRIPLILGSCDSGVSLGYSPDLDSLLVVGSTAPLRGGMALWHIPMDTYTPKLVAHLGYLDVLSGDSLSAVDTKRHHFWVQWQNMTAGNFVKGIDYRTGKEVGAVKFTGAFDQAQYDPKTDAVWVVGSKNRVSTIYKFSNSAPYHAKTVASFPGLKPLAQSMAINSKEGVLYTIAKDHPTQGPLPPFTPLVPDPTPFGNPVAPMPEQAGNIVAISLSSLKVLSSVHSCVFIPEYSCPKVMFWLL